MLSSLQPYLPQSLRTGSGSAGPQCGSPDPLFFKQVGGVTSKAGGRLLDGRTWDDFPTVQTDQSRSALSYVC